MIYLKLPFITRFSPNLNTNSESTKTKAGNIYFSSDQSREARSEATDKPRMAALFVSPGCFSESVDLICLLSFPNFLALDLDCR